jgi:archaeosine synthase
MLDIVSRSQRGRACEYSRGEASFSTPCAVGFDAASPVWIETGDDGRTIHILGASAPLERGLLTTASSGERRVSQLVDGIQVVRLPIPEGFVPADDAEIVVVPNAYEIRHDPRRLVDAVIRLREACGFGRLLCMLGIGEPSTASLLAYMGVDMLDCSLPMAAGMMGVRLLPEAEVFTGGDESEANVSSMQEEIGKIRTFIGCDRLRELADQRSFSSPSSVALLRIFDDVGYSYAEESCSTVGRRFCCNSTQAIRRPDLKRYRDRIGSYRKPPCKRVLLLLPCSAKKPYHISKTHKAFSSAIHTGPHDTLVHEVIVTSPLGMVPRELDFMYPANAYDIPVTGEWKCEEKAMIRRMVSSLISQGYDKVICHLGEDSGLVEDLAEMELTAVGDPASPVSLTNLDKALRAATKGMDPVDLSVERDELFRSVLEFQFGREAADALMGDDAHVMGKFPYWKLVRGKEKTQLAMTTPERGMASLTLDGARILAGLGVNTVEVMDFEMKGSLFAVGVLHADPGIRIGDEAIAVCGGEVRGVGVAAMCGREMEDLKRGVAVKIRHRAKQGRRGVPPHFRAPPGFL